MASNAPRDVEDFGGLLRRLRERAGLTQEELAERSGLSTRGISDLERGARRHPRKDTVRLLVAALQLPPAERTALFSVIPPLIPSVTAQRPHGKAVAAPTPLTALAGGESYPEARLPVPPDAFIGRRQEISAVVDLLRDPAIRLLTLTGPGGAGKTRLAAKVAGDLRPEFADGIAFVSLAAVSDPGLVPASVARSLGVQETGSRPLEQRLAAALRGRRVLLVLDNFEHVLPAAPLVTGLVATCPNLQILATSRTPLHVTGEHRFPVPPLSLARREVEQSRSRADDVRATHASPLPSDSPTPHFFESDAVALFAQRARQVRPDFVVGEANADAVVEICRRLDGLPLAIELAAARIALLSPEALLRRLDQRLPVLIGGPRDQPARQRSMRDAIAWSHDLLTESEQILFRRLAVFVDGFTLEAAERVTGDGPLEEEEKNLPSAVTRLPVSFVFDGLYSLLENSLLRQDEGSDSELRLAMLETVREFAAERLAASGEEVELRHCHADYFTALAEGDPPRWPGGQRQVWLRRLGAEHHNLQAALHWTSTYDRAETAARLAEALIEYWQAADSVTEGRRRLEGILTGGATLSAAAHVKVLCGAGNLARFQADYGHAAARYEEARALAQQHGDAPGLARALYGLAFVVEEDGDLERAATLAGDALNLCRELGDRGRVGRTLSLLGLVAHLRGDGIAAVALQEKAVAILRDEEDAIGVSDALSRLGVAIEATADYRRAGQHYRESLELAWDLGRRWRIAYSLIDIAVVTALGGGDPELAAWLFGQTEMLREVTNLTLSPAEQERLDRGIAAVRSVLDEESTAAAYDAGQHATFADVVSVALAIADDPRKLEAPIGLMPRELEILSLVADGRSDNEIAAALIIGVRTVDNHVANIVAKLGVSSRTAAVAAARRLGLV